MTRHGLARILKLAVASYVLLSCLLSLHTPAGAVAFSHYEAVVGVSASLNVFGLPAGTSLVFTSASIPSPLHPIRRHHVRRDSKTNDTAPLRLHDGRTRWTLRSLEGTLQNL